MSADKEDRNPALLTRKMRRSLAALDGVPPDAKAPADTAPAEAEAATDKAEAVVNEAAETGGPTGPEPTRYGDWERKGRCIDF